MGKAIPNAEILVVREDGSECEPDEPGELVHRGALVALGYWNDPERPPSASDPAPGQPPELPQPGDRRSGPATRCGATSEGFLYFVGRKDEMIKTSGYRVSPTEVEEVLYGSGSVAEVVALGRAASRSSARAWSLVVQPAGDGLDTDAVMAYCRKRTAALHGPGSDRAAQRTAAQPQRQDRPKDPGRSVSATISMRSETPHE